MLSPSWRAGQRRQTRGLSLVELMVGITIGLFVVAAASLVVTTQLRENKQLLLETQLQQDLRASADIIAREIRRAGYTDTAEAAVWNPGTGTSSTSDFQDLDVTAGDQGAVRYRYKRADNTPGPFRYSVVDGVIKTQLSGLTPPQDLTDKNVLTVERLNIELTSSTPVRLQCPNDCPPPALQPDACWPTVAVRDITVTVTGRAVSAPTIQRTITSRVRLRNDLVVFNAGTPSAPRACPE
jgi:type II secretory pathway component PulJ